MGDQDRRIMEWVGQFLQEQALAQPQEEEKDQVPPPQVPPPHTQLMLVQE